MVVVVVVANGTGMGELLSVPGKRYMVEGLSHHDNEQWVFVSQIHH